MLNEALWIETTFDPCWISLDNTFNSSKQWDPSATYDWKSLIPADSDYTYKGTLSTRTRDWLDEKVQVHACVNISDILI
jgi:hypothetical protein